MSRARGFMPLLAAVCLSTFTLDSAPAQQTIETSKAPQEGTAAAQGADSTYRPGWLLRGPNQNRIANPFRTTPAPGADPQFPNQEQAGRPLPRGITPLSRALKSDDEVPDNATASALGTGWTCNTGFRRVGSSCAPVRVPANASLDFSGHGWMCNPGFRRQDQACVAVSIPANATLDPSGTRWACNHGYRRQGLACVAVVVPEHASLDQTGHNWVCDSGYQKREQTCIDDATARLQQQAGKAVNGRPAGQAAAKSSPSVSVSSGENRLGRTSKAKVVIGRF